MNIGKPDGQKSKIIFSEKNLSVHIPCVRVSVCPSVPSRPVPKKSHRNKNFHWTKFSDVFQGWQKYIQSHTYATEVLGKAKVTGILRPASHQTSKFDHGHWSWAMYMQFGIQTWEFANLPELLPLKILPWFWSCTFIPIQLAVMKQERKLFHDMK